MKLTLGFAFRFSAPIAALSFTFVGWGLCAPPIAALSFTFVGWGLCAPLIANMCVGIQLGQTQQERKNTKTRPIPYAAGH